MASPASPGHPAYFAASRLAVDERLHLMAQALDYLKVSVVITDAELDQPGPRILYANQAFSELSGWSPEELAGQTPRILQGPQTDRAVIDRLRSDLEAGRPFFGETINYRKDGTPFVMEWQISPICDEAGGIVSFVAVQRDISRRKQLLDAVVRAQVEWTATVDAVADMILLEDADGRLLRCNRAAIEHLGQSFDEVAGRDLGDLFFEQPGTLPICFRAETATTRFPGSERWFEVINYPVVSGFGSNAAWVHAIRDVTARRAAERAARRLAAAVEQAGEGILILNAQGVVEYANATYAAMVGIDAGALVGRRLFHDTGGPLEVQRQREVFRALAAGRAWQGAYLAQRRDGSTYDEEMLLTPVRDEAGAIVHFALACRDVSERKRLESIAEAVNMMDHVGFLFATLRHELGNPINSLKTALAVLRANLEQFQPATVERYLDLMNVEVGRVEYLLKTLRSFNQHEAPRSEPVAALPFLRGFAVLVAPELAQRGISLVLAEPGDDVAADECLLADERALHQVLLNLVHNAADAVAGRSGGRVEIALRREGRRLAVLVRDNGPGLSTEQRQKLFRPFFTSKPKGTGLGLVIVKKLVARMGGTVEVESVQGKGATFRVSLPRP